MQPVKPAPVPSSLSENVQISKIDKGVLTNYIVCLTRSSHEGFEMGGLLTLGRASFSRPDFGRGLAVSFFRPQGQTISRGLQSSTGDNRALMPRSCVSAKLNLKNASGKGRRGVKATNLSHIDRTIES